MMISSLVLLMVMSLVIDKVPVTDQHLEYNLVIQEVMAMVFYVNVRMDNLIKIY